MTTQRLARVRRFLDAWESHESRGDLIYGLGVYREDEPRELLASDLRALLATVERREHR